MFRRQLFAPVFLGLLVAGASAVALAQTKAPVKIPSG